IYVKIVVEFYRKKVRLKLVRRVKKKSSEAIKYQLFKSRANTLIFIVFISFLILIVRLGYLQVVQGDSFHERVENAQYVKINQNVPRGEIYDRNGNVLVQNKSERAIFFTRHRNMSNGEIMEIAEKLSDYPKMDDEKNSLKDKQDYAINKYFDQLLKEILYEAKSLRSSNTSKDDFNEEAYNPLSDASLEQVPTDADKTFSSIYTN